MDCRTYQSSLAESPLRTPCATHSLSASTEVDIVLNALPIQAHSAEFLTGDTIENLLYDTIAPGTKKTKSLTALNAGVDHEHFTQGYPCSGKPYLYTLPGNYSVTLRQGGQPCRPSATGFINMSLSGITSPVPPNQRWTYMLNAQGDCRDFQHLAITLCRAMHIPARYATGYLGDIGVPLVLPMGFQRMVRSLPGRSLVDLRRP